MASRLGLQILHFIHAYYTGMVEDFNTLWLNLGYPLIFYSTAGRVEEFSVLKCTYLCPTSLVKADDVHSQNKINKLIFLYLKTWHCKHYA